MVRLCCATPPALPPNGFPHSPSCLSFSSLSVLVWLSLFRLLGRPSSALVTLPQKFIANLIERELIEESLSLIPYCLWTLLLTPSAPLPFRTPSSNSSAGPLLDRLGFGGFVVLPFSSSVVHCHVDLIRADHPLGCGESHDPPYMTAYTSLTRGLPLFWCDEILPNHSL